MSFYRFGRTFLYLEDWFKIVVKFQVAIFTDILCRLNSDCPVEMFQSMLYLRKTKENCKYGYYKQKGSLCCSLNVEIKHTDFCEKR